MTAITCLWIVCFIEIVGGFLTGGPITLCNDAYPHHHGHYRSETPTPFSLSLNALEYNPGDAVIVTIRGTEEIKGFQIGAHSTTGRWEDLYGEFTSVPAGTKKLKYYSSLANCVTHNKDFKPTREVEITWRAPNVTVGDLVFTATIVKDFETFWVNHTALVRAAQAVPGNSTLPTPAMQVGSGNFDTDLDLENCGKTSGCVMHPSNCLEKNCDYAVVYKTTGDTVRIRLIHNLAEPTKSYLSLGISEDQWMPDDETFTCADVGGALDLAHGFNPAMYNSKVQSTLLKNVAMSSVDGSLMCEFSRPLEGELMLYGTKGLQPRRIDYSEGVDTAMYHLYLSIGHSYPGSKESVEKHHILPIVSQSKVAFNDKMKHRFYTLHDNVKVHITLMVVAWGGISAIAMVVARFYRKGFIRAGEKLCGLASWFQVHRGLAFAAVLLTAISFVLIFVHYMKFSSNQLLHAIFGIIVMFLVLMQVIAGMARPDADAGKRRKLFNWIHRISGLLTYILAVVTMFIGTNIDYMSESLKTSGTGLIAAMMALPLLILIVLEVHSSCQNDAENSDLKAPNSLNISEPETEKKGNKVPFGIFVVYIVVAAALMIAYISVLWSN